MNWWDPTTFSGVIAATVAGLLLWAVLSKAALYSLRWWQSVTQFAIGNIPSPSTLSPWDVVRRSEEPLELERVLDGHFSIRCWSRRRWIPDGGIEVRFVNLRTTALPAWLPGNIDPVRPRVSVRGVGIDPRMGDHAELWQYGSLNEHHGAYRSGLSISGVEVESEHELEISINYDAREAWKGLLEVKLAVDGSWRGAYFPIRVL